MSRNFEEGDIVRLTEADGTVRRARIDMATDGEAYVMGQHFSQATGLGELGSMGSDRIELIGPGGAEFVLGALKQR
jgi:hypothetical protein